MKKIILIIALWAFSQGLAVYGEPTPQHTPAITNVTETPPVVTPTPVFPDILPKIVVAPFRTEPGELAYLRGLPLFRLQSTHDISGRDRAELLERRLEKLLIDDDSIEVEIKRSKDGIFLSCRDTTLIGIHDADVEAAKTTPEALAIRWAQVLEQSLQRTRDEQGAEFFKHALAITALSILLWILADRFIRRLTLRYLQTTGLSVRLLHALLWTTFIFWQFPATRTFALGVEHYGVRPLLTFLLVVASAFFCYYLLGRGIEHYFHQHELAGERAPHKKPRWRQRLHMTRQVTSAVTNTLLVMLAVVIFFSLLDVNLGALLAGASFLGVGLGLAAQNILKDWIAGVNIVLEDQFGDGDLIATDGFEGVVERFTLRITQIRDMSGSLITIPNSRIQSVKNQSNVWSQVDLSVPVSYRADTRKALEILAEVARKLAEDWPDRLQGEPVVLGVDEMGAYSMRLRMLQRTAPQQQFPVRRELLLRVKEAFDREGIEIPIQEMRLHQDAGGKDHPHPKKKS